MSDGAPNNYWLHLWEQLGAPITLAGLGFVWAGLARIWKRHRREHAEMETLKVRVRRNTRKLRRLELRWSHCSTCPHRLNDLVPVKDDA